MVLYGRLIHPWMMCMAWAVADMLTAIEPVRLRRLAGVSIVTLAVASWLPSAWQYAHLAYPADVLYTLGIDTTRLDPAQMRCELTEGTSYASPGPLDRRTRYPYTEASNYVLVNFCQGPPSLPRPAGVTTVQHGTLLFEGPHWLTFPAYGFELMGPTERAAMVETDYRVAAYRVP